MLCCVWCDAVQVIEEDAKIGDIHANSERFDTKSELSFKYLQVGITQSDTLLVHLCSSYT
jgi:hypothetical protein